MVAVRGGLILTFKKVLGFRLEQMLRLSICDFVADNSSNRCNISGNQSWDGASNLKRTTNSALKTKSSMNFSFKGSCVNAGAVAGTYSALPVAILMAMLAVVPVSRANQITTATGFGPFSVEAGEMTVTPDAGVSALLGGYSLLTLNQGGFSGSFQTFCVERNEYITPNTIYDVTLNNVTVFTGMPLTVGAAYLYQQFAVGQLNYNYANTPVGFRKISDESAYTLQHAIWYFMGEYYLEANNPYNQLVNGLFANPFAPDNGAHGVSIMNLWAPGQPHDSQHSFQDLLIYNPVPEPSTCAILSLAALLVMRRRK